MVGRRPLKRRDKQTGKRAEGSNSSCWTNEVIILDVLQNVTTSRLITRSENGKVIGVQNGKFLRFKDSIRVKMDDMAE
jgi:hypothetical protein